MSTKTKKKSRAAVELGRRSARGFTKKERAARALKAARARWDRVEAEQSDPLATTKN